MPIKPSIKTIIRGGKNSIKTDLLSNTIRHHLHAVLPLVSKNDSTNFSYYIVGTDGIHHGYIDSLVVTATDSCDWYSGPPKPDSVYDIMTQYVGYTIGGVQTLLVDDEANFHAGFCLQLNDSVTIEKTKDVLELLVDDKPWKSLDDCFAELPWKASVAFLLSDSTKLKLERMKHFPAGMNTKVAIFHDWARPMAQGSYVFEVCNRSFLFLSWDYCTCYGAFTVYEIINDELKLVRAHINYCED